MTRALFRRLQVLESNLTGTGLFMAVRFDSDGAATHYWRREGPSEEAIFKQGRLDNLEYAFIIHVPAEWDSSLETIAEWQAVPDELHPTAQQLLSNLWRQGQGGHIHLLAGQPGSLASASRNS